MRRLGASLIVLGAGVAVAALLGPLGTGTIAYHVVDDVLNQATGGDAVGLLLVAPACVVIGILALRRHAAAPVMSPAPAGYAVYTYTQLALGGDFAAQPGNSERFFPLFLALFVLGGWIVIQGWVLTSHTTLPKPSRAMRRGAGITMLVLAAFLVMGLHLPGLADVVGGAPYDVEYTQSPAVFLIVKLMDLGIVVPLAVAAGVGLLRNAGWAQRFMYVVLGWGSLLGSAVAGMAVVMLINDDPTASVGLLTGFTVFALGFWALVAWTFRPLFHRGATGAPVEGTGALIGSSR